MAGIEAVDVRLQLRDIGAVIGRVQRREQLLHHLAAGILEHALEARDILVAEGEVVRDQATRLNFRSFAA